MRRLSAAFSVAVFFCAGMALAQRAEPQPGAALLAGTSSPGPGSEGVSRGVKGAPLSARITVTTTRVLADGNRIHRVEHEHYFRDSEGRTRTEYETEKSSGAAGRRRDVQIMDNTQNIIISLNVASKAATIRHLAPILHPDRATPPSTPAGNAAVQSPQLASPPSSGATTTAGSTSQHADWTNEDLGTTDIEGFTASGMRITQTIPAGKEGNEQSIVRVMESWYSKELKFALLTKSNDPRNGETTREVSDIQQTEPDPSLFQVPEDYKVTDGGQL
jgi:hypothetical protein